MKEVKEYKETFLRFGDMADVRDWSICESLLRSKNIKSKIKSTRVQFTI
jgi:hypothetical protein